MTFTLIEGIQFSFMRMIMKNKHSVNQVTYRFSNGVVSNNALKLYFCERVAFSGFTQI